MTESPLAQASDDRLSQMLFVGEDVEEEVILDVARVVVTSHRVLVFTPDSDERRFEHADRPNVVDAGVESSGKASYLGWGVRATVYGAVGVGGGYLLNSSGVFSIFDNTQAATVTGVSGIVHTLATMFGLLTQTLFVLGAVALLAAAVLAGLYATTRERELVIERMGDEPIRIPLREGDGEDAAQRIRAAVTGRTGSNPQDD